jgi:type VI secretion system protein
MGFSERRVSVVVTFIPLAVLCALLAQSCSSGKKVRSMFGGTLPVSVRVDDNANDNSAIAVDMVVVYDPKLVDSLLKMTAADWFNKRDQMEKDYPDTLKVSRWEWVPGQIVPDVALEYHLGARKVVLFADYRTQGEHRLVVDPQESLHLVLAENDLSKESPQ